MNDKKPDVSDVLVDTQHSVVDTKGLLSVCTEPAKMKKELSP